MSNRYYNCKIIGDGQTEESAFRPAIADVLDPETGAQAFVLKFSIGSDPTGEPLKPYVLVNAKGAKHHLVRTNPDIDHVADQGIKDIKLGSIDTALKTAMLAKLNARGVDVSKFANDKSIREVLNQVIKDCDPLIDVDRLDHEG